MYYNLKSDIADKVLMLIKKQEILIKANINYADKVVILGHDTTLDSQISDQMLDAESIYIYQAVRKINKDV